ncbi:MAG: ABC transporter ATP-binding protein [Betaproteobacteria bacterium]|nr:MAG: ABC transporter ATP-binding protein [Betaproteobacteria bacterium]
MSNRAGTPLAHPDTAALSWRVIVADLFSHRAALYKGNLAAVLAVAAAVPVPLFLPILVDEVLLQKPGGFISAVGPFFPVGWHGPILFTLAALGLTLSLRLAAILLNVWQARTFSLVSKAVVFRIRERLLRHLERVALSEYETLGTGRVTSHFITDVNAIDHFLGATVSGFLVAVLSIVGVAGVLLWMHWQLALIILLLNPLVILFSTRLGKKVKQLKLKENQSFEIFQEALTETLEALAQVRAMNRERHYLGRVIDKAADIRQHAAAFAWQSDAMGRISMFVFLAGFDVFRAVAMLMVVYSGLSIGEMLAVFGYLWFMMGPVQEIVNIQYSGHAAQAALGRLNALIALGPAPVAPVTVAVANPFLGQVTVALALRDIRFEYAADRLGDAAEVVLNGVSLTLAAGEKVALVGASGGGKSTLVQALLGLYPVSAGEIRYGGVRVQDIGWDTVREHVGVVLQHPVLFNATVRENLSMGRPCDDAALWHALAVAQMEGFVRALPQGLDAIVGRNGVRLSGGQRQRLAIARMVLTDPKVVILDEATSALDTETERAVHRAMADFLRGRTTLIIAHRLSAVRQADRIFVFEAGRIVEEGDHDGLIRQGGLYRTLYGEH